jgi:hypothetical protein
VNPYAASVFETTFHVDMTGARVIGWMLDRTQENHPKQIKDESHGSLFDSPGGERHATGKIVEQLVDQMIWFLAPDPGNGLTHFTTWTKARKTCEFQEVWDKLEGHGVSENLEKRKSDDTG